VSAAAVEKPTVLFGAEQIARRVAEVGAEIAREYEGRDLHVVGLMKSCLVLVADLIRAVPRDVTLHLLRVSSPRERGTGDRQTEIVYSTAASYEGKDVLVVDDIVDTGITLSFLLDRIREQRPRSLKVCALIDRPGERKVEVRTDWALFTLEGPKVDEFLVGYGLDYEESYRGLPYLGIIHRPPAARGIREETGNDVREA
jgi:hypoxanthine phosphoribosyltransferase